MLNRRTGRPVKTPPTLAEILCYQDPTDKRIGVMWMADLVDKRAQLVGCTEMDAHTVMGDLGCTQIVEFAALKDYGVPIYKRGGFSPHTRG